MELETNSDIQVRKFKTRRNHWCFTCNRFIPKGATRIEWRLMLPFTKGSHTFSGMFWTRQCFPCYKFSAKAWSLTLAKL